MSHFIRFRDRHEAGRRLAERLQGRAFVNPLVLAVPRGGVAVGAALAHDLQADFDVILARKLRAPNFPEVAIGAIAENGTVYLNDALTESLNLTAAYLNRELRLQTEELHRRARLFRSIRPPAPLVGRSVLVVDDGIATGATLIAALQAIRAQNPLELIVAVPVAAADCVPLVKRWCDEMVCLIVPEDFEAVGHYYEDFHQLDDEEAAGLFRDFTEEVPITSA